MGRESVSDLGQGRGLAVSRVSARLTTVDLRRLAEIRDALRRLAEKTVRRHRRELRAERREIMRKSGYCENRAAYCKQHIIEKMEDLGA